MIEFPEYLEYGIMDEDCAVNPDHPLNVGTVSWWIVLNNLFGATRFYDVMRTNHAVLTNGATWDDSQLHDDGGKGSLFLAGTDEYAVTAAVASLSLTGPMSVGGWWRTNEDFTTPQCLISNGIIGTTAANWGLLYSTVDTSRLEWAQYSGGASHGFPTTYTTDAWRHVYVTRTSTKSISCYVNGALDETYAETIDSDGGNRVTKLGRFDDAFSNIFYLNGWLNDWRVYNRVLTAHEVKDLYDLSRRNYEGLFRRRRFLSPSPKAAAAAPGEDAVFNPAWARYAQPIGGGVI